MTPQVKQRIEQIRRGEVPDGYKRTKVGIVPAEWEEKRIGDVLAQRRTLMCISEETPLLSFTIEEGVIDPANKKSNQRDFLIKDMATKKFALTEVGDIIYNPANLKFGAIHRNNLQRGVVSPIYGIFYGEQDSVFMGYLLHSQRFIDYAKIYTEGTVEKLKSLKSESFLRLKIILPPLFEQKKIAEILQTQDKLIELQQKKIEELKKLKKAYLSKMFPKKGCNVPEIRFPGFTDPWEQRKVGEVSESYSGGTPSVGVKEYYGGQIPFIRSAEINSEITELFLTEEGLKNSSARLVAVGDILYALYGATSGEVGRARLKGAINQAILAIKPHTDYDSEYLAQWLRKSKHSIIETYLQGGQGNLSGTIVKELSVDFPSLKEQKAIGDFFRQLDNLITLHQRKLEEMKIYKKSLMQLLLTGIVRM